MKVIIAGSRDVSDLRTVCQAIEDSNFEVTELVCGMCRGVDILAHGWAKDNNIQIKEFPADWDNYGSSAGPIRNAQMAKYADALIALPAPRSKGTRDMILKALDNGLDIFVRTIKTKRAK